MATIIKTQIKKRAQETADTLETQADNLADIVAELEGIE